MVLHTWSKLPALVYTARCLSFLSIPEARQAENIVSSRNFRSATLISPRYVVFHKVENPHGLHMSTDNVCKNRVLRRGFSKRFALCTSILGRKAWTHRSFGSVEIFTLRQHFKENLHRVVFLHAVCADSCTYRMIVFVYSVLPSALRHK